jgi:hypothetical protein
LAAEIFDQFLRFPTPAQELDSCATRVPSLLSEVLLAHHEAEIKKRRRPIIKATNVKSERYPHSINFKSANPAMFGA